jgi:hypothetical protein
MFLAESTIQLVPDGTLLLHLLMVVVMVAVVNRTLLKPLTRSWQIETVTSWDAWTKPVK